MPVQEADELDPFRGSVVSDEEVVLESQGTHVHDGSGGGEGGKRRCISILLLQVMLVIDN